MFNKLLKNIEGVWRSYSWAESRALEAGVAAGEDEVCLTTLGRSYTVDLTAMQQLNDHTGTARPVQRVAPPPNPSDQGNAANGSTPGKIDRKIFSRTTSV